MCTAFHNAADGLFAIRAISLRMGNAFGPDDYGNHRFVGMTTRRCVHRSLKWMRDMVLHKRFRFRGLDAGGPAGGGA